MQNNFVQEEYRNAHVILPEGGGIGALLLGDFNAAIDDELINRYNIRTIITAAEGLQHLQIDPKIKHHTFKLLDNKSENIAAFFGECSDKIQQGMAIGSVLVHCAAGVSRSATLVVAYLMRKNKWNFRKALDFVKGRRPCVCPNLGFQMQLKAYHKQLIDGNPKNNNPLVAYRSRNIVPENLEAATMIYSKQFKGERGGSFPIIPQSRGLLKRNMPTRSGIASRQNQRAKDQQQQQQNNPTNSRISGNNIQFNLQTTNYQKNFRPSSKSKHKFQDQSSLLARNLAKLMFGSHAHKWNAVKVIEHHIGSRASRRTNHFKR